MSTYLKSAAMSLLSKTVQTFLTKYLSDVDVEGVTLPSYDGSGWGVRLSNVRLREGVQLMKMMPGKVTKKRTVIRKRRKRRMMEPEVVTKDESKDNNIRDIPKSNGNSHSNDKDYPFPGEETKHRLEDLENDKNKPMFLRSRTNSAMSTDDLDVAPTGSGSSDYYTDDELSNDENPTSVQPTNSLFACFVKRKTKQDGSSELNGHSVHQGFQEQELTEDVQISTGKIEDSKPPNKDIEMTESNIDDQGGKFGEDERMYEYYEEEEEYEEEQELPLGLFIGEEGRIGTIDVRQIGKELHIMVEDAMVTIEAIPILPEDETVEKDENSDDITGEDDPSAANDNDTAKESGENDGTSKNIAAGSKNSTKKENKEPKRDTVGDRVLADNRLARLIASIPLLFLRDIRVRLIVRDEPMAETVEKDGGTTNSSAGDQRSMNAYSKRKSSSKDTMVEVGIDFLCVTSGEDILSRFQKEHSSVEDDLHKTRSESDGLDASQLSFEDSVSTKPPSLLKIPSNFVDSGGEHTNEYLIRHIRTGRGPSAGISVQLFLPNYGLSRIVRKSTLSRGDLWARQHWISSTNHHLLRFSGLDIQARIHMGTKTIEAGYSWFYGEYGEDDEDGDDFDSMLLFGGGMVTVAPGAGFAPAPAPTPSNPTPPREFHMNRGNTPMKSNRERELENQNDVAESQIETSQHQPASSMHPGVDAYHVDANGIQSCNVPSSFHRVSRGMILKSCKESMGLPSEVSGSCWEEPSESNVKKESSLDSSMPMPGLALQISIRDPLEINVDRSNMESIGLVISLFTKPSVEKSKKDADDKIVREPDASTAEIVTVPSGADDVTQTTSTSTGFLSGLLYGKPEETVPEEEVPEDSFESYMQPESISIIGIYLAETVIRVHIMREDKDDRHLSFCYWKVDTKCLTLDHQSLAAPEKSFSDIRLDVGELVWDEYRGTSKQNLASLGVLKFHENSSRSNLSNSSSSMIDDHAQNKAPWPSTACALLDISPPTESLRYKSREGHGLQFRFISTPSSGQPGSDDVSRSMIYLRLGLTTIDSNWAIRKEIRTTIKEILNSIRVGKESSQPKTENVNVNEETKNESDDAIKIEGKEKEPPPRRSLMAYTIQVDSGNISIPPLIEVNMPMTRFSGEQSSLSGFSIESELGKVDFAYGSKEPDAPKRSLLLPQIARLPESLRMHILFCLKDLSPIEIALKVKKEKNSFRRIKSIDKAILKTAKTVEKRDAKYNNSKKGGKVLDSANKRERILAEIMKLDDSELTNLWSVHRRYQRKLAKKLRDEEDDLE